MSRFGDDGEQRVASATALATALHMQRGTPFVYQGEELGMTNVPFASIADFRDIESLRHYAAAVDAGADPETVLEVVRVASRDNARTPMQWDASTHAGFTAGEPWIMVNPNHTTINAAAARADPGSVFHHYRRLIALRRERPVVALGDFTALLPGDEQVFAFSRRLDGEEVLTACNLSGAPAVAPLDGAEDWLRAELLLSNHDDAPTGGPDGIVLRPWEAVVWYAVTPPGEVPGVTVVAVSSPAGHRSSASPRDAIDEVHGAAERRLSKVGQRHTRQRREILERVASAGRPVTVPDLLAGDDSVSQSSLYRNLVVLVDVGVLQRVAGWGNHDRFELSESLSGHHHHHLTCTVCGKVDDITPTATLRTSDGGRVGGGRRPLRRRDHRPQRRPLRPLPDCATPASH